MQKSGNGYGGLDKNGIIKKVLKEEMPLQENIRIRIDDFKQKYWAEKVIGVHIRYTDRKNLGRLLDRYPDAHIFLATDNKNVEEEYKSKFKNVFSTSKWYPESGGSMHQNGGCENKVENGIEALVDMYLLADCDGLVYSGQSTFSVISSILSDANRSDIIDIDRFNLKLHLKTFIRELVA